jgi:hypothetical protein
VNLKDPDQFPNPETGGTGFFCFGLALGHQSWRTQWARIYCEHSSINFL